MSNSCDNSDLFCDEPINRVYKINRCGVFSERGKNAFLSFSPEMEYHCTEGFWVGFETDNHFIVAGYDGVKLFDNKEAFPLSEYEVDCDDWGGFESVETMIFKGERIKEVIEDEDVYVVHLDHFDLKLYPYFDRFYYPWPQNQDIPIKAASHCIKRKCDCGGDAEVMFDFVGDFGIRCSKCHLSTYHTYILQKVLDDWENRVDLHIIMTAEEFFYEGADKPVDYIAISEPNLIVDEGLLYADSIMVGRADSIYEIRCIRLREDVYDFQYERFGGFNPELWPLRIVSTEEEPLRFIGKETQEGDNYHLSMLRFMIGDRPLLITADDDLSVGISHWDSNGEWMEFENNSLGIKEDYDI